jgi:hypothetical protein
VAKAAAIFVIALVLVAAVLLRPAPTDVEGPAPIAGRPIAMHAGALPGVPLHATGSEATGSPAPHSPARRLPAATRAPATRAPAMRPPAMRPPAMRSDSSPNAFRTDSELVQRRFRVRPESGYGATQLPGTIASAEVSTATTVAAPLAGRPLPASADAAPTVGNARPDVQGPGHVTGALDKAAHHTSSAFRIAARTLRSVF